MHSLYSTTRPTRAHLLISDPAFPADRKFTLQFNPENLTRKLSVAKIQETTGQGRERGHKAKTDLGAPSETMTLKIRLDHATRQEGTGKATSEAEATERAKLGLLPEIAALESLVYPSRLSHEKSGKDKRRKPLRVHWATVVLVWGERHFPVRVTAVNVNELLHARNLVPIRAEVELTMELRPGGYYGKKVHEDQRQHHEQRMRWGKIHYGEK